MFGLSFTLGPLTFTANGGAGIYSNGIALDLQVSLNVDATVFSITASGTLQINTTSQTELGIAPGSFYLAVSGQVDILKVFDFNASMTIYVGPDPNTGAEGYWSFNANANMSFFGLATLSGTIFLDSDGNFRINLNGQIVLGSSDFGLVGQFSIFVESQAPTPTAPYYTFELSGSASVSLNVFGISLAGLGVGFDFKAQGTGKVPITLSFDMSIHFLFWTIHKSGHSRSGIWSSRRSCSSRARPAVARMAQHGPVASRRRGTGAAGSPQPLYLNVGNLELSTAISAATGPRQLRDQAGRRYQQRRHDPGERVRPHRRPTSTSRASSPTGRRSPAPRPTPAAKPSRSTPASRCRCTSPAHRRVQRQHDRVRGQQQRETLTGGSESNDIVASGPSNVDHRRQPRWPARLNAVDIIRHTGTGTATITSGAGNWFIVGGTSMTRSRSATATTRSPGRPGRSRWGMARTSST